MRIRLELAEEEMLICGKCEQGVTSETVHIGDPEEEAYIVLCSQCAHCPACGCFLPDHSGTCELPDFPEGV